MSDQILVVDDELEIANLVKIYLEQEGYAVLTCANGADALDLICRNEFSLAILDVMLPDMDGFELCRRIREREMWPILMLTAKDEEGDKIHGLTLGADDYLTKPFRPMELVARVKAQLRRRQQYDQAGGQTERIYYYKGLVLDVQAHKCRLDERPLELTPTEFTILKLLLEHRGRVISGEELFHLVWQEAYYIKNNNSISVHMRHLRAKLGDTMEHPKYIRTVWGVGYTIEG